MRRVVAIAGGYDPHRAARTIMVNQALARAIFPGEDPLGRTILTGRDNGDRSTIIGVVGNIRASSLGADPIPLVYSCACENDDRFLNRMAIVVRTTGDPHSAIAAVQQQIYAVDRNQPVFDVSTMDERLAAALSSQRFQLILVGCFALIATLLAAAGVYGVMSYLAAQRGREIGIRMALGARPADVIRPMVMESVGLSFLGTAAGIAGAFALTHFIKSILYGITPVDAPSFSLAPVALWIAVLVATIGPAHRSAKVDPVRSLRE